MDCSQIVSLSFQGVLVLFTIVLAIATSKLHRSTKRYAEITRLDFAQRMDDYYEHVRPRPPLSTIMLGFQKDLDNKVLSPDLRREFKNIGISLSKNAYVVVRAQNATWAIIDGSDIYIIDKQENKLGILMDEIVIKRKVKEKYGNLLRKWLDKPPN